MISISESYNRNRVLDHIIWLLKAFGGGVVFLKLSQMKAFQTIIFTEYTFGLRTCNFIIFFKKGLTRL